MTTTLLLTFPQGRYHATPWGRQVNEGTVELPPSPWRLLRALYAVWRARAPQLSEEAVHGLLAALAAPPTFHLPRHTVSHTRHYYPDTAHRSGAPSTDLTLDAFAVFESDAELAAQWPFDLPPEQREALRSLAASLPYFGRAESLCEAAVPRGWTPEAHGTWVPLDVADEIADGPLATGVLAPELPLRMECLLASPVDVRRGGLLFPEGTRMLGYQRVANAPRPKPAPAAPSPEPVTAVRFAVLQAGLPPQTDALVYTDLLRQAALSKVGAILDTSVLAGKTGAGEPLAEQHRHAHYLPILADGRITGLLVWAPQGLPGQEWKALRAVRRLHSRSNESWRAVVRVGGVGEPGDIAPELAGPARVWESATPFTPAHYPKRRDDRADFLAREVARELSYRELRAAEVELIDGDWASFRRYRPTARQRHDLRQGQASRPGAFLRLRFAEPAAGPIVLGHLSHFGLGLFTPVA